MAQIINGKKEAELWQAQTRDRINASSLKRAPALKVVLLGDDPASRAYVSRKTKVAAATGIDAELIALPASTSEPALISLIGSLNADPSVDGILVQLPLPSHVSDKAVIECIAPEKDVDGFHPENVGRLQSMDDPDTLVPCTPMGCMRLISGATGKADLSGMNAAIIGRSNIVGKPMAALLLRANCTILHLHSRTPDPQHLARQADILIAAVGRPKLINEDWVKDGAIIIDVGINRVEGENGKSKLVGDVDFDRVQQKAGAITPVPGGVGPMTVAGLMHNTLLAAAQAARRGAL